MTLSIVALAISLFTLGYTVTSYVRSTRAEARAFRDYQRVLAISQCHHYGTDSCELCDPS